MITAVFFDFFGVLAPGSVKTWIATRGFDEHERLAELSAASDAGDLSSAAYFHEVAQLYGVTGTEITEEIAALERVNPEVVELLGTVSKGYATALISNSSSDYIRHLLERFELEHYFDHILVSAEIGMRKPDVAIFQTALEVCRVTPEEAIFIDDSPENVAAAESLGMHGIDFRDSQTLRQQLIEAGVRLGA